MTTATTSIKQEKFDDSLSSTEEEPVCADSVVPLRAPIFAEIGALLDKVHRDIKQMRKQMRATDLRSASSTRVERAASRPPKSKPPKAPRAPPKRRKTVIKKEEEFDARK